MPLPDRQILTVSEWSSIRIWHKWQQTPFSQNIDSVLQLISTFVWSCDDDKWSAVQPYTAFTGRSLWVWPMLHCCWAIVCGSAVRRGIIKARRPVPELHTQAQFVGSWRQGGPATELSQHPAEGCEISMINNYNYLQMCQLLSHWGYLWFMMV